MDWLQDPIEPMLAELVNKWTNTFGALEVAGVSDDELTYRGKALIDIETESGVGTTISITFPLSLREE